MSHSTQTIGRIEFIALMAMLVATIAFSIDGMLPALPDMAQELTPDTPNRIQLVLVFFIGGLGLGTLIAGPLSDSFGRKSVILGGAVIYSVASLAAFWAQSIEVMLIARACQGIGAAAPRVVSQALVRDLFKGREMAKINSFVMMVFTLVPAIAPMIGSFIIWLSDWRGIFAAFVIFVVIGTVWMHVRIVEPITSENKRPFRMSAFLQALNEMAKLPMVRLSILVQILAYTVLFLSIMLVQPIFDIYFDRADTFPYWFAFIAILAGSASILNAMLVMRFGMRRLITAALLGQLLIALVMLALFQLSSLSREIWFFIYVGWVVTIFFGAGMTLGNLTALGLEPLGHIAGTATSIMGAIATVLSAIFAGIIGQFFDGTPLAQILGVLGTSLVAYVIALRMNKHERVTSS